MFSVFNQMSGINSFESNGYNDLNRYAAQDCAKSFEGKNNNSAREMTAADLGLPEPNYTFWLGAHG